VIDSELFSSSLPDTMGVMFDCSHGTTSVVPSPVFCNNVEVVDARIMLVVIVPAFLCNSAHVAAGGVLFSAFCTTVSLVGRGLAAAEFLFDMLLKIELTGFSGVSLMRFDCL
jgi:hypothetical protein